MKYSLFEFSWFTFGENISSTLQPNIKEKYFSFSGSVFLYNRFILSKIKNTKKRGFFLDLGAGYRLPYVYNYFYFTDKNTRTSIRKIHKFNDFELFSRLGYANIAIFATYQLTDALKSNYYQTPKLTIGLGFPLQAD